MYNLISLYTHKVDVYRCSLSSVTEHEPVCKDGQNLRSVIRLQLTVGLVIDYSIDYLDY